VNDIEILKEYLENYLSDIVSDETPHGEHGDPEPSMLLRWKGKAYRFSMEIFWNRYDKQYYYQDGIGWSKLEEIDLTPEQKGAVECLWDIFGGTETDKGFKMLHERVGLIYGDSITLERADEILKRLAAKGFASSNIVFGIGSYTYQFNTRDSFGFAMKATYGEVNGEPREIFKDPVTDSGTKKSAKGLLCVYDWEGDYYLKDSCPRHQEEKSLMQTVFEDGNLLIDQSLSEIRLRLMQS